MLETPGDYKAAKMKSVGGPLLRGRLLRAMFRMAPPTVVRRLLRADSSVRTAHPVLVFRVDDFPRWDHELCEFERFHRIFEQYQIPYILGVTPWLEFRKGYPRPITSDELTFLRRESTKGLLSIALHGFTHESRHWADSVTEIATCTKPELQRLIEQARQWFDKNGLPFPECFIPPFNSITMENLEVLSNWFRVILAGSTAISTLGPFKPQAFGRVLYLPSYGPLYGSALRILRNLSLLQSLRQVHIVTLHWAWEIESSFANVEELVKTAKESFAIWSLEQVIRCLLDS
ncbi:MAG: DUF2334 domain-containing protein [Anaerolineae bacterium]